MARVFVSGDQWVERTEAGAIRYYDGVHRGCADTLHEALLDCQQRYDYARGVTGREPGTHVYGSEEVLAAKLQG